jgi:hypothetical protein
VTAAVSEVDALWEFLVPKERERLIRAIVKCDADLTGFRQVVPAGMGQVNRLTRPLEGSSSAQRWEFVLPLALELRLLPAAGFVLDSPDHLFYYGFVVRRYRFVTRRST